MTHRTLVCLVALGCGAVPLLRADALLVGTSNTETVKPFGDGTVESYQQIYSSSLFAGVTGAIDISELDFYVNPADSFDTQNSAEYQVYLSGVAAGTLDPASSIANRLNSGLPAGQLYFDGTVSLSAGDLLPILLSSAFQFDPTQDLVLEIERVTPTDQSLSFALLADQSFSSAVIDPFSCSAGCVYDGSDPNLGQLGLVTNFVFTPVQSGPPDVPEPATLVLFAAAALLLMIRARRASLSA